MAAKIIRLFSLLAGFALSLSVFAGASSEQSFVISKSDLTRQLSQVSVFEIFQDSTGFIWVLTQDGLNRYDGKENVIFRADVSDPSSLSNDVVRDVAEDSRGTLWFATSEGGLNKFIRGSNKFEVLAKDGAAQADPSLSPLSNRISELENGIEGKLWLGYQDGGVSAFHPSSATFRHFAPPAYPELRDFPVTAIVEKSSREVLVATDGGGLLILDPIARSVSKYAGQKGADIKIGSDNLSNLYLSDKNEIWIATVDSGVYRLNGLDRSPSNYRSMYDPLSMGELDVVDTYSFYEAKDGRLFLATGRGIGIFSSTRETIEALPVRGQEEASIRINSIIIDNTGLLWAGGYSGVFSGIPSAISLIDSDSGLVDQNVLSVATLRQDILVVGTTTGLDVVSRIGGLPIEDAPSIPDIAKSPVTAILVEKETLWLGTYHAGLYKIDLNTGSYTQFLPDRPSSTYISHNQITDIFRDSKGNLWVGTNGGGLNLLAAGGDMFWTFSDSVDDQTSLSSDAVMVIYEERNGDLWIGTEDGLNRYSYETGKFQRFMHLAEVPGSLSSRVVVSIYEDKKSRLWVGTEGGGLNMWSPLDRKRSINRFEYFQSNIGLPSSNIYAIQGDSSGNIWLATSGGLTRFNYDLNNVKNFTVDDGLQSNDFNFGASFKDSQGRLYFGGTSGLNIFNPSDIRTDSVPPNIVLTRISLGNEQIWFENPYSELEKIELQPDDYLLGFSFAALDFRAPHRNKYRYQMVGLDRNWVDLGNRNTLDFSKLPMGQYVLRIQGANPDGVWSPEGIVLDIIVHPPFYLTWYAFVAYTLGGLLLIALFFYRQRLKAQEQLQYQTQLEDDVRARTLDLRRSNEKLQVAVEEMGRARQDAERANQAKSEFLAALSHEIRTPMHGVLGMTDLLLHSGLNERQQNFAESAHVSANELLSLIDNILDFSKIEAGKLELEETTFNLREMAENLCYLYGELAQAKNLELNLVFNADLRRQLYGDPVRLRQILQNLLSNAIKFTKRGSVNLVVNEVTRKDKTVGIEFLVEDTGIGMTEDTVERVFEAFSQADSSTTRQFGGTGLGLSIAKQLIDLMQGELKVNSRSGVGTTMSVQLAFVESPIYTEHVSLGPLQDYSAEVVAPMPETRAMFRSQLEALGMRVRECSQIEEVAVRAEHQRVVLVDVGSLYSGASIAQVENLEQDAISLVLLVTPLSGAGIPPELKRLPHTTKPVRMASLLSDLKAAESKDELAPIKAPQTLLRFDKHILLVEDITANQEIARAMLESFGCGVAIARNGEVALEMFQQEDFDLVLMDCQMPVMDGFQATRHIRKYETHQHDSRRVPVVALTAGKTEAEKERCYAAGMDRILFKPYTTADLNEMLSQYFTSCGKVAGQSSEKAASSSESSDVLDMKAVDNIRNIDTNTGAALLAAVFENFKLDGERKLQELRDSSDDVKALGAGAHAIKSMSLNMGAKALSEYCRRCEARWKEGKIDEAPREIEVLAGHFRDASRALEQLIAADGEVVE